MALKILALDGLNDAKLCTLVEQLLRTVQGVSNANIDFFSQRLTLDINGRDTESVVKEVSRILEKAVPGVSIKLSDVGSRTKEKVKEKVPMPKYRYTFDYNAPDMDGEEEDFIPQNSWSSEKKETPDEVPGEEEAPEEPKKINRVPAKMSQGDIGAVLEWVGAALCLLISLLLSKNLMMANFFALIAYLLCAASIFFFKSTLHHKEFKIAKLFILLTTIVVSAMGGLRDATLAVLIYQLGAFISSRCYANHLSNIEAVLDIVPEKLEVLRSEIVEPLPLEQIVVGDHVTIPPGIGIPFDGMVVSGESLVTPAVFLGKSETFKAVAGTVVTCGDKNGEAPLVIEVYAIQDSCIGFELHQELTDRSGHETQATLQAKKWSLIYTLVALTATVVVCLIPSLTANQGTLTLAVVLITLCAPCGLSEAISAVQLAGRGVALKSGIVFGMGYSMGAVAKVKAALFGFTGVLTGGKYLLDKIDTTEEFGAEEILGLVARLEENCDHPIARAILEANKSTEKPDPETVEDSDEEAEHINQHELFPGYGIRALVGRKMVLTGSGKFMRDAEIEIPPNEAGQVCVYTAIDGEYIGTFALTDPIKPGAAEALSSIRSLDIDRLGLLTGCDLDVARVAATQIGMDEVYAEQSDIDKSTTTETLGKQTEGTKELLFIGNEDDIMIVSSSCTNFILGECNLNMVIGSVDAVIPSGELEKVAEAIGLCKSVEKRIKLDLNLYLLLKVALFGVAVFFSLPFPLAVLFNSLISVGLTAGTLRKFL